MDAPSPWSMLVRNPMVRIAAPVAVGMVIAALLPVDLATIGIAFGLLSLALGLVVYWPVAHPVRWRRGVLFACWACCFGVLWYTLRDPRSSADHITRSPDGEGPWALRIEALNGVSEKLLRADAQVLGRWHDGTWDARSGRVMISLLRGTDSASVRIGDKLLVDAPLTMVDRVADPGGFDRKGWAASRGMSMELFAPRGDWTWVGHSTRWTDLFTGARMRVAGWIEESGMPLRERALVKALVLGLRDELDGDQRNSFVRSGTIHVLAVSGTHVGFIYAMLFFLFGWWGQRPTARLVRGVLILLALWGYAGLTGAAPSVLRATIMFSIFTAAGMFARRNDALNSLFAAGLCLLVWDPHMLVEVGFQLSFLAVLGIVLFYAPLHRLWSPDNWLVRNIWSLGALSIAAQLFTTPLSIFLFKAFPVWFLPANLIVVTAAGFAVYGAVALLILYKVPVIGGFVTWVMSMLLSGVGHVTGFFAALPGAYPPVRIGIPEMLLLYILVIAVVATWLWKWRPGWYMGGIAVACLLVFSGWRTSRTHQRTEFTVYDDRHALNAAITVGRSFTVLSDDDIVSDTSWMHRKVERHQRALGLDGAAQFRLNALYDTLVHSTRSTLAGGGRWSTPGINVWFYNGQEGTRTPDRPIDVLVVHDIQYLNEDALDQLVGTTRQVVLAGEMGWRARATAKRWCTQHAVPIHDIRDRGAFILSKASS